MLTHTLVGSLFVSLVSPIFSAEDYYQVKACCTFKGPNFQHPEYILIPSFNKQNMMEYNSTRGNWIGLTEYAAGAARIWNKDPGDALLRMSEMTMLCINNIKQIQSIGNLTTSPTIKVKSVKQSDGKHPAMLLCSAFDFYPKQIIVTWLRDGQEVTDGVSYSDVMSDGDLYYQFQSHLEYFPTSGEKISCMVEHLSLSEPKVVDWDDSFPMGGKIRIAVGLCGLIVGLVVLSSGFIYYRKTSSAYSAVCQERAVTLTEDSSEGGSLNKNNL